MKFARRRRLHWCGSQNFERPKKGGGWGGGGTQKTWSHTRREKKTDDTLTKWDFRAAAQEAKRWFVFTAEDQDEMKAKLSGGWRGRDGWSHGGRRSDGSQCSNDDVCWAGEGRRCYSTLFPTAEEADRRKNCHLPLFLRELMVWNRLFLNEEQIFLHGLHIFIHRHKGPLKCCSEATWPLNLLFQTRPEFPCYTTRSTFVLCEIVHNLKRSILGAEGHAMTYFVTSPPFICIHST